MIKPFEQNIITLIWDFDKTLIPGYMQDPLFNEYKVDAKAFWNEVNSLYDSYKELGIKVNKDTVYLNHLITCTKQGIFKGLNNAKLRELGDKITFYKGVPEVFENLKKYITNNKNYQKYNITLENYIVSTGLTEMIKGSKINSYVDGIWGCEFIENPIKSSIDIKLYKENSEVEDEISQVAFAIDNTTKTRAIFEINKGVNEFPDTIDVNSNISNECRRVPIKNMIYIADGPSDVPSFSVVKQYGGKTYAVYPESDMGAFKQVDILRKNNRVDMYGVADYTENSHTYMWLLTQIDEIALRIYDEKEIAIRNSISEPPKHLV